jgi:hypothetical protein
VLTKALLNSETSESTDTNRNNNGTNSEESEIVQPVHSGKKCRKAGQKSELGTFSYICTI